MAEEAIAAQLPAEPAESRPLAACFGRILREDVYAERDNPPFDRVCMDGIAVRSHALARGLRRFRIEATQAAGAPAVTLEREDAAIEVMTGAIVPHGTDCVIPLEEYELADGMVTLHEKTTAVPYRNVQRRGEDSAPGVPMLTAGTRLRAPEIAVAASAGLARLSVSRQPRLMVVSTGDELIEPGEPIAEHQIRRSNAYAVAAALRGRGFEQVGDDHLLDDEAMLSARLALHLADEDVLILSGGVSKGRFDLVPKVLKHLGVREVFYQVAQRPGMPMWFGATAAGKCVFGLPGNPVSTLICLLRYVVPAVDASMHAARVPVERVALAEPVKLNRALTHFMPVAVRSDEGARLRALPRSPNGPGDFLSLKDADGFIELPPSTEPFPEGFPARLYRW